MSASPTANVLVGERDTSTFRTNYLVEAGAGKSYTMTNRIVNLLLAEQDDSTPFCSPEQLVAITFTVKATQELQSKLEQEFGARLEEAKKNLAVAKGKTKDAKRQRWRRSCALWPSLSTGFR